MKTIGRWAKQVHATVVVRKMKGGVRIEIGGIKKATKYNKKKADMPFGVGKDIPQALSHLQLALRQIKEVETSWGKYGVPWYIDLNKVEDEDVA